MEQGAVRNLEQIQEHDDAPRIPRGVSVALVMLGGACIAFAAVAINGRKAGGHDVHVDPLGDLVAQHGRAGGPAAPVGTALSAHDVTFPGMLSDDGKTPTTALAAVRALPAAASEPAGMGPAPTAPPPPTDRLPVVGFGDGTTPPSSLPAQNVLEATPVVTRPRDPLTRAASDSAQLVSAGAPSVAAGHDGGYQLQVSSFRSQTEAAAFADQLRARGHKAYVLEAHVNGRGTWYRVRVGPFGSQHTAAAYRSTFEAKEHVVPFIVLPPKAGTSADH
jgi:DedD protein